MAGSNLRKFTNPSLLRSLEFGNLIKLMQNFDGYFSDVVGFQYKGIEQEKFNFDELAKILTNPTLVSGNEELFDAFALIGAMSSASKEEILREFIETQSYNNEVTEKMSVADLAVLIYLNSPNNLNKLDIESQLLKKRSFATRITHYNISNPLIAQKNLSELEDLINSALIKRHLGPTAKVYPPSFNSDEYSFSIRRGESFRRQGVVVREKESKTLAFQPEAFDLLVLNIKTGELRICTPASLSWLENCYAQALGKALYNDYSAFAEMRNNNLNRIKELGDKITIYNGNAEVKQIDLLELHFFYSPQSRMINILKNQSGDLFRDMKADCINLAEIGDIFEAKFAIKIGDIKRTIILKNNNRSGYEYDGFGIIVDEWLRAVGIIPSIKTLEVAA